MEIKPAVTSSRGRKTKDRVQTGEPRTGRPFPISSKQGASSPAPLPPRDPRASSTGLRAMSHAQWCNEATTWPQAAHFLEHSRESPDNVGLSSAHTMARLQKLVKSW